jgi:hypothetical protein
LLLADLAIRRAKAIKQTDHSLHGSERWTTGLAARAAGVEA